ncbi:hypothetical protein L596_024159 [Steinernema carpocapsae]|uniref:Uncharacterized protein n=1 Tax=Steinernema carpocapsae TaxID=34508 RepID=A0A4U5MFW1_STECR|nr:hypothetical protein L596_024159 [Steinernema carpocapsae]
MSDHSSEDDERYSGSEEERSEEEEEERFSEEFEEEGPPRKKPKKKRNRPRGCDFILDDVDVDDDDDEEAYDDGDDFGIDPQERAEAERAMREHETRRNRRGRVLFEDLNEDELERYVRERYEEAPMRRPRNAPAEVVSNQSLQPSHRDPNLWIVKCQPGAEQEVCLHLARKQFLLFETEKPLQITSVVHKNGLKGMIYIEAYKKSHVLVAIQGVSQLNGLNIKMVPLSEMQDTMKVIRYKPQVRKGDFVRLAKTMYKGDLAQVDWVNGPENKINLKLIPRIDYTKKRGALREPGERKRGFIGFKNRPPLKMFDAAKLRDLGGRITEDGAFQYFERNYYMHGFLFRIFTFEDIICEGIQPSLAELKGFQSRALDDDTEFERIGVAEAPVMFVAGDVVEMIEGELVGLTGVVQKVAGNKVTIFPKHDDLEEDVEVCPHEIKKFFKVADRVKIIGGTYEGEIGSVVLVKENSLVVVSSDYTREMPVLKKDARIIV